VQESKIITPNQLNTTGIKPSEDEPLEVMQALARRVQFLEREFSAVRTRLYNIEVECQMLQEKIDATE